MIHSSTFRRTIAKKMLTIKVILPLVYCLNCVSSWNSDESYSARHLYPCELKWKQFTRAEVINSQFVSVNESENTTSNKFIARKLEYGKWRVGILEIKESNSKKKILKWNGQILFTALKNKFHALRNPHKCQVRFVKYPIGNIFQTLRIIFKSVSYFASK